MSDTTYNGWTNYETWNWKLWMDNDQGSYEYWRERTQAAWDDAEREYEWQTRRDAARDDLAGMLKHECDESAEQWMGGQSGPFADLLNASISAINWDEIAGSLLDDLDLTEDEDESAA